MKKKIMLLSLVMLSTMSLFGCKKEEPVEEEHKEEPVIEESKELEEPEEVEVKAVKEVLSEDENLLTGLPTLAPEAIGKRPFAIMVNNVNAAMPQYGIEQADVIFELPVEEDLTRFMAMYGDYTNVPKVCAIRSCRYNFPTLSEGFDAFYAYWGMSESTQPFFDSLEMDYFNGMVNTGGLFGRDQDRLNAGYPLEHTATFNGTGLVEAIEGNGMRSDIEEDNAMPAFLFQPSEEQVAPIGEDCNSLQINFGAAVADFTYDAESKLYAKKLNGNDQIDGNTGNVLTFSNVFVLETEIGLLENGVHKKIDMVEGNGYYISNGVIQEIQWEKEGGEPNAPLLFFGADDNELIINRGKSYISFTRADSMDVL